MPSDDKRTPTGLPAALQPLAEAFHSQISMASEEVREWHLHHEDAVADPAGVLAAELGEFAQGRIDTARMASVVGVQDAPDPILHHVMALAEERFAALVAAGDDAFRVTLSPGGDLRDAVRDALADLGRAFAMGRAVQRARAHTFRPDVDHMLLRPFPFHRWAVSEKAMAPPIVIELEGADLRAAGLAEYLDGTVRIVLRVKGAAPPAPLARIVSPGIFVAQAEGESAEVLADLATWEGPGVVALFDEGSGALTFRAAGSLEVDGEAVEAALGRVAEERGQPGILDLRHLAAMAAAERASTAPMAAPPSDDPRPATAAPAPPTSADAPEVDRLAAWLLAHLPADSDPA